MSKPEGYPLPWCEAFNTPYWKINISLCALYPGWFEKQSHVNMPEIIPWIDELIEKGEIKSNEDIQSKTD